MQSLPPSALPTVPAQSLDEQDDKSNSGDDSTSAVDNTGTDITNPNPTSTAVSNPENEISLNELVKMIRELSENTNTGFQQLRGDMKKLSDKVDVLSEKVDVLADKVGNIENSVHDVHVLDVATKSTVTLWGTKSTLFGQDDSKPKLIAHGLLVFRREQSDSDGKERLCIISAAHSLVLLLAEASRNTNPIQCYLTFPDGSHRIHFDIQELWVSAKWIDKKVQDIAFAIIEVSVDDDEGVTKLIPRKHPSIYMPDEKREYVNQQAYGMGKWPMRGYLTALEGDENFRSFLTCSSRPGLSGLPIFYREGGTIYFAGVNIGIGENLSSESSAASTANAKTDTERDTDVLLDYENEHSYNQSRALPYCHVDGASHGTEFVEVKSDDAIKYIDDKKELQRVKTKDTKNFPHIMYCTYQRSEATGSLKVSNAVSSSNNDSCSKEEEKVMDTNDVSSIDGSGDVKGGENDEGEDEDHDCNNPRVNRGTDAPDDEREAGNRRGSHRRLWCCCGRDVVEDNNDN